MKKDGVTLRSRDLNGYGVLKWRVQFLYFSIRPMCLVQRKLFELLRGSNVESY